MPIGSGSGIDLKAKIHFKKIQEKSHHGFGWLGFLRIVATIIEIGISILAPEIAPVVATIGATVQEGFDIYSFAKSGGRDGFSFGLNTVLNFLPVVPIIKGSYGASKNVVKVVDNRFKSGFKYIVKGEEGFDKAFNAAKAARKIKGGKFLLMTKREAVNFRRLNPSRFLQTNKYMEKLINKYKELDVEYKNIKSEFSGHYFIGNKDISAMNNVARKLFYKEMTLEEAVLVLRRDFTPEALNSLRKATGWRNGYNNFETWIKDLREIFAETNKRSWFSQMFSGTIWKSKSGKFKITGRGMTQTAQLLNPNDVAREIINRASHPILNAIKKQQKKMIKAIENSEKKLMKFLNKIKNSGKFVGRYSKALKVIVKGLKENGTVYLDHEFVVGHRVIIPGPVMSQVMFFFNPKTTAAKSVGSNNYGGKKPVITWVSNVHLAAFATSTKPGQMYLKGARGFAPIALNPGGRLRDSQKVTEPLFGVFAAWIPMEAFRNALSIASNFKSVGLSIAKGTYGGKWLNTLTDTWERLGPTKLAKLAGSVLGMPFGKFGIRTGQKFARAITQGFQKVHSETIYINGVRTVRRRTTFSFSNKFNAKVLYKQAMPTYIRTVSLRHLPKFGSSRAMGAVGARLSGNRRAKNVRRIAGLFR